MRDQVISLESRLVKELLSPGRGEGARPIIVREPAPPAPTSRLIVLWDDWEDLDALARSEMIMDAYIAAFGLPEAAKINVAMGLTSAEARRMGRGS